MSFVASDLAEKLLAQLASQLGDPLAFDESGQCALEFEDDVELVIAVMAEAGLLSLRSPIVPADPARCRTALQLNYGRLPPGTSLALCPASGMLVALRMMPLAEAPPQALPLAAAELIALVLVLRDELATPDAAPTLPIHWSMTANIIVG